MEVEQDDRINSNTRVAPMEDVEGERVGMEKNAAVHGNIDASSNVQDVCKEFRIAIGMTFNCLEQLYQAYNAYAVSKGFGIRKGKKIWRKTRWVGGFIHCSCEGKSDICPTYEERQRERLEYRCYCRARVKYTITDCVYKISQFTDIHTHEMIAKGNRHFIQSARFLAPATKQIIDSLVHAGVGPSKVFRFLADQAGGVQNVDCIEQDVHNHHQSTRSTLINGGDAQALIDYLSSKKAEDSHFYFNFKVDDKGRLCNVFWRDSISKVHYESFGDVMTFDTTYRTNKWNMVFAPFVGVNNHWQNIYFGCAFLSDESTESFEWLFKAFLESMDNKHPKTIFTDQDHAMASAITSVLPNARHRLCGWHIEKNAVKNIPHLMSQAGFRGKFNTLLWDCKSEEEFNSVWKSLSMEWNVANNSWLQKTYNLREKWCPGFSKDTFSCNIKSTQRGESANRVFSDRTCQSTALVEFIKLYEQKVLKVRETEALWDTRTRGKPRIKVRDCGMLEEAAEAYTKTIFSKFQDEFMQCLSDWIVEKRTRDGYDFYSIHKEGSDDIYSVFFQATRNYIVCSCHMFETIGLLCCHALRVLHTCLGFKEIPKRYILKRWTKKAKQGTMFDELCRQKSTVKSSVSTRLNDLLRESFSVMSLAADNDNTVEIAKKHLYAAKMEIVECQNRLMDNTEDASLQSAGASSYRTVSKVQDPINKRRKGQKNVRLQGFTEKRKGRQATTKKAGKKTCTKNVADDVDMDNCMADWEMVEQMDTCADPGVSFSQLISHVTEVGFRSRKSSEMFECVTGTSSAAYKCIGCGMNTIGNCCSCVGASQPWI